MLFLRQHAESVSLLARLRGRQGRMRLGGRGGPHPSASLTLQPLDHCLQDALATGPVDAKHRVVFSHIPPFINALDEDNGYFNLDKQTRSELVGTVKAAGVRKWFCGHYHRNAGGFDIDGFECIITAAVGAQLRPSGVDPLGLNGFIEGLLCGPSHSGLRLVKVREACIEHRWFTMDSVPWTCDAAVDGW